MIRAGEGRGGVGLGLTICRGIVTAHGGRLWVENRPGGGASFRFTIPLQGTAPQVPADEDSPLSTTAPVGSRLSVRP